MLSCKNQLMPFPFPDLIDPQLLATVMVSPRTRAKRTFELLFQSLDDADKPTLRVDERVREWTYGAYEGNAHLPYLM
jgi:broad specificity phosphatase PhoE